jgi:anti-anti-sigma regulatory factor
MVAYEEQPAVLRCYGDEDLATQGFRRRAFARALKASGDLVVDLSELVFADSSLIFDLAVLAQRTRSQGRCLSVRDAQPQITRLIEMVGLDRQPGVQMA